jgi:uncharacterized protein (TIGR00725 family)
MMEENKMSPRPIIGVFGSDAPKESIENILARAIGAEIVKRGDILLTGSNGDPGKEDKVKEVAIAGAKEAVLEGAEGAWIGVDPKTKSGVPTYTKGDHSFIIGTKLGDQRNYLEAALCDVAIALKGRDGTTSEVTFCLALNKPVVLIGDWQEFPRDEDNKAIDIDTLLRKTYNRVKLSSSPNDFEKLLQCNIIRATLEKSNLVHTRHRFPDEKDVGSFTQTIVDLAVSYFNQPTGAFPDALTGYDEIKRRYQDWLRSLD